MLPDVHLSKFEMGMTLITTGFLYRAGAETPLNFREKIRVFRRTILENFLGVDTQTAVLVSTAEVWVSAPDTQTPIFLGVFWVSAADFGFSAGRRNVSDIFLRCLSRKSVSQHQLRIKTLPSLNLGKNPGKGYIPPPHHPIFAQRACFREGGGCMLWSPPRQEFYTPPLFYTPPTPRRAFSELGGGVIKFAP